MARAKLWIGIVPLLLAASEAGLSPGLWEVRHVPQSAMLDGKLLDDMPLGEPRVQRVCLAAAEAGDPAAFFTRDTKDNCRIEASRTAAGRVEISGSCPNPEDGSQGRMKLSGRYASDSYELDFSTTAEDFQGVMTFNGKLSGRRIGPCPAGK